MPSRRRSGATMEAATRRSQCQGPSQQRSSASMYRLCLIWSDCTLFGVSIVHGDTWCLCIAERCWIPCFMVMPPCSRPWRGSGTSKSRYSIPRLSVRPGYATTAAWSWQTLSSSGMAKITTLEPVSKIKTTTVCRLHTACIDWCVIHVSIDHSASGRRPSLPWLHSGQISVERKGIHLQWRGGLGWGAVSAAEEGSCWAKEKGWVVVRIRVRYVSIATVKTWLHTNMCIDCITIQGFLFQMSRSVPVTQKWTTSAARSLKKSSAKPKKGGGGGGMRMRMKVMSRKSVWSRKTSRHYSRMPKNFRKSQISWDQRSVPM